MVPSRIRSGVAIGSLLFAATAQAQTLRFDIPGLDRIDRLGASLAIVGDLDGDGFADLLIGAPGNANSDLPSRVCLFTGAPSALLATPYRMIDSDQLHDASARRSRRSATSTATARPTSRSVRRRARAAAAGSARSSSTREAAAR